VAFKKNKIDFPFTEEPSSIRLLDVVRVNDNPNSHNYPIGPPILILGRSVAMIGYVIKSYDSGNNPYGCYINGAGRLVQGNWLPGYPGSLTRLPSEKFIEAIPEAGTTRYGSFSTSQLGDCMLRLLEAYSSKEEHAAPQ
jgi:hypothetical protein